MADVPHLRFVLFAAVAAGLTPVVGWMPVRAQAPVVAEATLKTLKVGWEKAGDAFHDYVELQKLHAKEREDAHIQLAEDQKNALHFVVKGLADLASLKKSMAKQLRCLGTNQISTAPFEQCWADFVSENGELRTDLDQLKRNMDLADPGWSSAHVEDVEAIDDLYREKVGIENKAILFLRASRRGIIFPTISVNLSDSQRLADDFDAEATKLSKTAKALSKLLPS